MGGRQAEFRGRRTGWFRLTLRICWGPYYGALSPRWPAFHGGVSLQETVVPALTVRLESTMPPDVQASHGDAVIQKRGHAHYAAGPVSVRQLTVACLTSGGS